MEADLAEQYTLTGLLMHCDRSRNFLAGSVVVVDEAGMADTRQLAHLANHAAKLHAKLVLVGDPAQIPEVDAGGAFAHLVDAAGEHLVVLAENHRQVKGVAALGQPFLKAKRRLVDHQADHAFSRRGHHLGSARVCRGHP